MGGGEAARRARGRRHARGPGASRKQAEGGMQQAERGRHAQRQACKGAGMAMQTTRTRLYIGPVGQSWPRGTGSVGRGAQGQ